MAEPGGNGWNEYKRLVMSQLEELNFRFDRIDEKLDRINTKVVVLETKAIFLGALAGLVVGAVVQIVVTILKT